MFGSRRRTSATMSPGTSSPQKRTVGMPGTVARWAASAFGTALRMDTVAQPAAIIAKPDTTRTAVRDRPSIPSTPMAVLARRRRPTSSRFALPPRGIAGRSCENKRTD